MGTIFHYQTVSKIEFQLDNSGVLVLIALIENGKEKKTSFLISHSELNRLLGVIQHLNPELDLLSEFNYQQYANDLTVMELDMTQKEWNNSWISDYRFKETYREIRA